MEQKKWWSHFAGIAVLSTLVMAEPDDDDEDDETDNNGGDGTGGTGDGDGGNDPDDDDRDPKVKIKAQEEVIERLAKRDRERAKQLEDLLAEKKKRDEAALTAEQKRDKELEESKARVDALTNGQKKLVVKNAFLESNDYQWQNPGVALRLLDTDGLEIEEEDGEFSIKDSKALKARIKTLADENPYLLKSTSGDDDDKDKGKQFVGRTGDTPKPPKKGSAAAERAKVLAKYPSLRK